MGKYSKYNIILKSLSDGKHDYEYQLMDDYFKLLGEDVEIKKGNVNVDLTLKKANNTFELNFLISGQVKVPCDRCLDEMVMPVETKNRLIVKFGAGYSEESDEIVIIPEDDGQINLAWFLYEFVALSLPMKKVHPQGECNKTMTSKLKRHNAGSSSDEGSEDDGIDDDLDSDEDNSSNDSRWDALKDIQFED